MMRKIYLWLIERLYRLTYERVTLDKQNQKLIRPVPGLLIDGVQYFEFVNKGDMPHMRMVQYGHIREEMVMGIDRKLQMEIIDKILEANEAKDTNRIGALGYMFKDIVANITTIESLYNIASVAYFDEREDIGTYDLDYNRQKIEQFKKLRDKGFFFGYLMRETLKTTGAQLPPDIQKFLNENAVKLNAWKQLISEPTASTS